MESKRLVLSVPWDTIVAFKSVLDIVLRNVVQDAQTILQEYAEREPPPPALVLTLTNEVFDGAKLYAIQKSFVGEFSFDVYYDAEGVRTLDGNSLISSDHISWC